MSIGSHWPITEVKARHVLSGLKQKPPRAPCRILLRPACVMTGMEEIFEARYLAFLETITHLRPSLHRYCARMTGSALDGEDVVQDALFQAYRKLDGFDDARPLAPWLFRIAHNRCIDFLRRRMTREEAEAEAAVPDFVDPEDPPGRVVSRAVEHLVVALPPMERACVLLKDVFDHSLEEIAELVGSTIGGVKAALHRGRAKLSALPERRSTNAGGDPRLLSLYVERFNRRDWDGVRDLIAADARVRVADRFAGPLAGAPYFGVYERMKAPWQLMVAEVDDEAAILVLRSDGGQWTPDAIVRIEVADDRITGIADYTHCPWLLSLASVTYLA